MNEEYVLHDYDSECQFDSDVRRACRSGDTAEVHRLCAARSLAKWVSAGLLSGLLESKRGVNTMSEAYRLGRDGSCIVRPDELEIWGFDGAAEELNSPARRVAELEQSLADTEAAMGAQHRHVSLPRAAAYLVLAEEEADAAWRFVLAIADFKLGKNTQADVDRVGEQYKAARYARLMPG